jgi:hypothetical protein
MNYNRFRVLLVTYPPTPSFNKGRGEKKRFGCVQSAHLNLLNSRLIAGMVKRLMLKSLFNLPFAKRRRVNDAQGVGLKLTNYHG